jgi:hypothetical protein
MYVPDANLVLTLLKTKGQAKTLPAEYQNYLAITRRHVGLQWQERKRYIPVDASLASLELSQSGDRVINRSKFDRYFYDHIQIVHGLFNVNPSWVDRFFEPMSQLVSAQLPSLAAIFEKALDLIPPGDTASDTTVEAACDELFGWLLTKRDDLSVLGGPAMYVAVYAIAGSPDARRIMKVHDARKSGSNEVAWNVAWDFIYLHHMDGLYLSDKYEQNVFCTGDGALATLMASRVHKGPRYTPEALASLDSLEVGGDLESFKFKKLENTKLSKRIAEKYAKIMTEIAETTVDIVTVGF